MENTLVTYFTQTENTKKVAESIYKNIEGDKQIMPISEVQEEDLEDYDLIFIGFPVHSHGVPFATESFIKKIPHPDEHDLSEAASFAKWIITLASQD